MSNSNKAPLDLKKEELCLKVAKRIKRISPGMSSEDIDRKARRAVKVLRQIQDLPRYSQVINMTHQELNLVLQECPESPYFLRDDFETSYAFARKLVLAFVDRSNFDSHEPHHEADSSEESSQSPSESQSISSVSQQYRLLSGQSSQNGSLERDLLNNLDQLQHLDEEHAKVEEMKQAPLNASAPVDQDEIDRAKLDKESLKFE